MKYDISTIVCWKNLMELKIFVSIELTHRINFFEICGIYLKVARFFFPLSALFSIWIVIWICINIRISYFESNWVHFCFILFHPCMQISDRNVETLYLTKFLEIKFCCTRVINFEHKKNFLRKASGEMHVRFYFSLFCIYIFQGKETTWKIISFKRTACKTVANVIPSTIMDWDIRIVTCMFLAIKETNYKLNKLWC